jgi:aspartyl aminopeptidase
MTEAKGEAVFAAACDAAGVTYQPFVNVNTIPGGSTIGPIAATRLGIPTVDIGVGLLSMHSVRELVHVEDLAALHGAVAAFLTVMLHDDRFVAWRSSPADQDRGQPPA